ncbi:MAG TPA: hypothetical protein VEA69_05675 [Tepidisphaeraceae bacterium]|nr:hypothetical protein [Tepidisphaeraceae bacterium]
MPDPTNTLGNNDDVKTAPESGDVQEAGRTRGQVVGEHPGDVSESEDSNKTNPDPSGRLQEDCSNDPHYASGRHEAAPRVTQAE